jgi:hypothetical protein
MKSENFTISDALLERQREKERERDNQVKLRIA